MLTASQEQVAREIVKALREKGIENPYYQAALVGIAYKETGLKPINEASYSKTSAERIKKIFPSKMKAMSSQEIDALKQSDVNFFDFVYGGKYGNQSKGDGYKYRGRGLNGITFKGNYEKASDTTGVDLVKNPERLNEPKIAARAFVGYFLDTLNPARLLSYGLTDINQVEDLQTAVRIAMRQNAGWGSSVEGFVFKEGEAKAHKAAAFFFTKLDVKNALSRTEKIVSKNKRKQIIYIIVFLIFLITFIILARLHYKRSK